MSRQDADLRGDGRVTVSGDGDDTVTVGLEHTVTAETQAGRGVTPSGDDGDGSAPTLSNNRRHEHDIGENALLIPSDEELLARYEVGGL